MIFSYDANAMATFGLTTFQFHPMLIICEIVPKDHESKWVLQFLLPVVLCVRDHWYAKAGWYFWLWLGSFMLKFRYFEKATKFEKISTSFCHYLVTSKQLGSFFQIFAVFSQYLNQMLMFLGDICPIFIVIVGVLSPIDECLISRRLFKDFLRTHWQVFTSHVQV